MASRPCFILPAREKEGVRLSKGNAVPAMKPAGPKERRGGSKLRRLVIVFFITLFLVLFFQSSISKISQIQVEGNELVSEEEIIAASGARTGDNFFTTGTSAVSANVQKHPFIETVEVVKSFPGVLKIHVEEFRRVAFQLAEDGTKEVLLADGSALPVAGQAANVPLDMPILSGWAADNPLKAKLCFALSQVPQQYLSDISEIRPDPSTAYEDRIKIYTRSRYEVLTTIEYLPGNIQYLGFLTNELKERGKDSGVITMLEQIRHAPFEGEAASKSNQAKATNAAKSTPAKGQTGSSTKASPKPTPTPSSKTNGAQGGNTNG
jgi:cell division protein FtsQ